MGEPSWPRLEVSSIWLKNKDNNSSSLFKGRIFIVAKYSVHEIYNSAKLDGLYKNSSRRRRMPSSSGHTDLPDRNEVRDFMIHYHKYKKRYSAVSEKTDLVLGEVLQVVSDNTDLLLIEKKKEQAASLGNSLPVTGPTDSGMIATSNFHVLVHKDSGDPKIEDGYVKEAECSFIGRKWSLPEEDTFVPFIFGYRPSNQPCHLKLNCDFGLLTLECTEFPSSKSVQLNFEWQNPNRNASTNDYYICGSLTVTPNIDTGVASVLLKTPPNEAVKVTSDEHGRFIPLLKSVVAVPFSSSFTVNAQLQYSDNANSAFSPIVENGAATFPVVDDDQDALAAPEFSFGFKILTLPFYKSTKYIAGIDGGLLKVTAHEPGLQNNTNIDHESEDSSEIDENNSGRNGALSIPLAAFDFVARLATGIFSRGRKHLDPFPLGSRGENELQSQTSMNFSEKRASNDDSSSQKSNANDNNIAQNDHGERAELVAAEATKLDMAICNSRSTEQEIPACYEDDACGFKHFDITRDPAGHHFLGANGQKSDERNWLKKVQQDWSILQNNLPDGIHVRV